jgi:glycosyltransferase involved in cell wall biosynthesis
MQASPHAARWIELVAEKGWDLHFFPVDEQVPSPNLRGVTLHWPILDPAIEQKFRSKVVEPDLQREFSFARRLARIGRLALRDPPEAWRRLEARLLMHEFSFARRLARIGRLALRDPPEAWRRLQARLLMHFLKRGASGRVGAAAAGNGASTSLSGVRSNALRRSQFMPTLAQLGGAAALEAGSVRLGESDCTAPVLNGPGVLVERVRALGPDLIHSMEFQHSGYLVLRARELYGPGFPTWLATNWGSDIFYFGRFPDHRMQIERLLAAIDFYSCECERDISIARQFGYRGPAFSGIPNSGGFDLKQVASLRSPQRPSQRKVVMIKGYQHFAGRALTALKVLEKFASQLKGYRIVLFSVSDEPRRRAHELQRAGVLDTEVIDWATHEQILTRFAQARLYMAISISDAISTSSLEAMAMGAFPIQTNTSCCDEWFKDGQGGFIVPPDDFDAICDKFGRALADDALVDRAAEVNWRTVQNRLDNNIIAPKVADFYDSILAARKGMH